MNSESHRSNPSRFSGNRFNYAPDDNNGDNDQNKRGKRQKPRNKKPRKKKTIIIVSIIAVLLAIFGVKKWYDAKNAVDSIFDSAKIQKSRDVSSTLKQSKPISILLLGTDTGALGRNYRGRTDTIIVATLNPKKKKMTLTSIPRDTVMSIPGYSNYSPSKINAAYDLGGAGTAIKAVEKLLNIPIDYYGLINMGGLEKIVDGVGGIDITPKLTFKYGHADVTKGKKIHLNGKAALDYSRMRYTDPNGDYGRQTRQRQVLMAILRKSDSITALLNQNFLKSLQKQTKTDLTFNELLALSTNYRVATHHLKSTHLQGTGTTINGGSYELASKSERQRVTNFIRKALDLSAKTTGTTGLSSAYTGEVEDSDTDTITSSDTTGDSSSTTGTDSTDNYSSANEYSAEAPTSDTNNNTNTSDSYSASAPQANTQNNTVDSNNAQQAPGGNF
jgi:LCP family protein required for cell wall assembly